MAIDKYFGLMLRFFEGVLHQIHVLVLSDRSPRDVTATPERLVVSDPIKIINGVCRSRFPSPFLLAPLLLRSSLCILRKATHFLLQVLSTKHFYLIHRPQARYFRVHTK